MWLIRSKLQFLGIKIKKLCCITLIGWEGNYLRLNNVSIKILTKDNLSINEDLLGNLVKQYAAMARYIHTHIYQTHIYIYIYAIYICQIYLNYLPPVITNLSQFINHWK